MFLNKYSTCLVHLYFIVSLIIKIIKGDQQSDSILKDLKAECTHEGIKVKLWFKKDFSGIAYSNGHYETPKCRYIMPTSHEDQIMMKPSGTNFSFLIPISECGTIYHGTPLTARASHRRSKRNTKTNDNEVYIENTLLIQNDPTIQEVGDLAKTLRCVWPKEIHKPLVASLPFGDINSKLDRMKIPRETQRIMEISSLFKTRQNLLSVPGLNSSNVGDRASYLNTKSRHRFQKKGQVQSVPISNRRYYSRSLNDEISSSSSEAQGELFSTEDVIKGLVLNRAQEAQESLSAIALPLRDNLIAVNQSNGSPQKIFNFSKFVLTLLVLFRGFASKWVVLF